MSAWSDYRATQDEVDLEIYRQECQADEDEYWQEVEEEEKNREIAEFEEYQEIIHLKNWKDDVVKSLAEYDAETVEEVYRKGRADVEMIGVTEDGEYIQYKGHLYKKVAERLKEQK